MNRALCSSSICLKSGHWFRRQNHPYLTSCQRKRRLLLKVIFGPAWPEDGTSRVSINKAALTGFSPAVSVFSLRFLLVTSPVICHSLLRLSYQLESKATCASMAILCPTHAGNIPALNVYFLFSGWLIRLLQQFLLHPRTYGGWGKNKTKHLFLFSKVCLTIHRESTSSLGSSIQILKRKIRAQWPRNDPSVQNFPFPAKITV